MGCKLLLLQKIEQKIGIYIYILHIYNIKKKKKIDDFWTCFMMMKMEGIGFGRCRKTWLQQFQDED